MFPNVARATVIGTFVMVVTYLATYDPDQFRFLTFFVAYLMGATFASIALVILYGRDSR